MTAERVKPAARLLPLPAAVAEPDVRFEARDGKRIATVKWPQHTDTLTWSDRDGSVGLAQSP